MGVFIESDDWVERFIALNLADLAGRELSPADEAFLLGVELMAQVLDGALEESLLLYGLGGKGVSEGV